MPRYRSVIKLPDSFEPNARSQRALAAYVRQRFGPEWTIQTVDLARREAICVWDAPDDALLSSSDSHLSGEAIPTVTVRFGPGVSGLDEAHRLVEDRYGSGYSPVEVTTDYAVFQRLPEDLARVREEVAAVFGLGSKPWHIQVTGSRRKGYTVSLPAGYRDTRYAAQLQELAANTIGEPGWSWIADPQRGIGTFKPGKPPTFPEVIPLTADDLVASDAWSQIYLGQALGELHDPKLHSVFVDFSVSPHMLITGTTGGGKSVATMNIVAGALAKGWRVIICELEKGGLDFIGVRRFIDEGDWVTTYDAVHDLFEQLQREVERRRAILHEAQVQRRQDLPASKRFPPILLVIDEVTTMLGEHTIPKSLPKDHPDRIKLEEENATKALAKSRIQVFLQVARFVGLHLLLATQYATADTAIPPRVRQLTTARLLLGVRPQPEELRAALKQPSAAPSIPPWIVADQRRAIGVGIAELEGQPTRVVKFAFAPSTAVATLIKQAKTSASRGHALR